LPASSLRIASIRSLSVRSSQFRVVRRGADRELIGRACGSLCGGVGSGRSGCRVHWCRLVRAGHTSHSAHGR
jgi:hypothetical protein